MLTLGIPPTPRTGGDRKDLALELLERLRREQRPRFNSIFKQRLSFYTGMGIQDGLMKEIVDEVVDSFDVEDTISRSGKKKGKALTTSCHDLFGRPLTQEGIALCQQLADFLIHHDCLATQGLFRIPGCIARINDLRVLLSRGEPVDKENFTSADVASTLKAFLMELPEPVLTSLHWPVYLNLCNEEQAGPGLPVSELTLARQFNAMRLLVQLLPAENAQLLRIVLQLLHQVAARQNENRMNVASLAKIFVPALFQADPMAAGSSQDACVNLFMRLSRLVGIMIGHSARLFLPPNDILRDVMAYYESSAAYEDFSRRPQDVNAEGKRSASGTPTRNRVRQISGDLEALSIRPAVVVPSDGSSSSQQVAELIATIQAMPDGPDKQRRLKGLHKLNRHTLGLDAIGNKTTTQSGKKDRRRSRSAEMPHGGASHGIGNLRGKQVGGEQRETMQQSASPAAERQATEQSTPKASSIYSLNELSVSDGADDGVQAIDAKCRHCECTAICHDLQSPRQVSASPAARHSPGVLHATSRCNAQSPMQQANGDMDCLATTTYSTPTSSYDPSINRIGLKLPAFDEYRSGHAHSPLPQPLRETLI